MRSIMVTALIVVAASMMGCDKEIKEAVRPVPAEIVHS
jgi:hypothetical protein